MKKMQSARISMYKKMFAKLEKSTQEMVLKAYEIWQENPARVDFKELNGNKDVYSVRINARYRSLCKKVNGKDNNPMYVWFFVGSHEDYNNEIKNHKVAEHIVDYDLFLERKDKMREKYGIPQNSPKKSPKPF